MAAAAIDVIRRRSLRVPEDIAVVGFNDIALAQYLGLTTIQLCAQERGRLAMERLLQRMQDPELPRERVVVPTQLVVRESCGSR